MHMSAETVVWLCIVLFMVHEFEEIAFIHPWLARNAGNPGIRRHVFYFLKDVSTSTFAILIGEEFVLAGLVALVSVVSGWYAIFAGLLISYTLHLVGHLLELISYRMYLPSVVTSALTLPWFVFALAFLVAGGHASLMWTLGWGAVLGVVFMANIGMLHRSAPRLEGWMSRVFWQRGADR